MSTRESEKLHKVALLATGDEIITGDILNSNAQEIAKRLYTLGIHIGMHAATSDQVFEIKKAMHFLLESHDALIITGGLGPTSDDLTRFALAEVVDKPLVFDNDTWENIVARLKRFGYDNPPESNRQQALFPQDATIIANPDGTAAGCFLQYKQKLIFMLPGPPSECLPMVDKVVIPTLLEHQFYNVLFRKSWLLFNVSEGQIAEEMDALAKPFDCITGYRIAHPYLEFKIISTNEKDFNAVVKIAEEKISSHLISDGKLIASDVLKEYLLAHKKKICIHDHATGGLLQSILETPATRPYLLFNKTENADFQFTLAGLEEYWGNNQEVARTDVKLQFGNQEYKVAAPNRGERARRFAAEWACFHISKIISEAKK